MKFILPLMLMYSFVFTSCNTGDKTITTDSKLKVRTSFFDKTGMDTVIKPGDNFFTYANGSWLKNVAIPDDQSGWGSLYTLFEDNQKNLKALIENAAKSNSPIGSLEQKTGDYYTAGMDTVIIEKKGAEPLKPVISRIDSVKNYKDLINLLAKLNAEGNSHPLLAFSVDADEKNSSKYIPIFSQAGLSLPEKSYYTRNDSASIAARNALLQYAKKMFILSGTDNATAAKNADDILKLETSIAISHRSPVETRDPQKNYNKMSVAELQKKEPNINWAVFFSELKVTPDSINIQQPEYYSALNELLVSQPIDEWKSKIKFSYISANATTLNKDFRDANFSFAKVFNGQKTEQERWKKMISRVDEGLGELAGQLYVKKYFSEDSKKRMDELVNNLQKSFSARIQKNEWMSDSTKQRATKKLNSFLKKIGYTSKWKKYDDVVIDKNDFFGDALAIKKHFLKEKVGKIGKNVDRTEWGMTPPTVNAYYNPTNNEIVFPAGILQFPFFDPNADDAINYGGIGMVIGHEMTHGFDDQGSQYDEKGNMNNWFSKEDLSKFKAKTGAVIQQYNTYTMFGTMHVNGALTLGENLADIGGLAIAYDAFKMTKQGMGNDKIDGFTPDQRFFLSFAQIWRLKDRDENMLTRMNTDPHSPEMFRVNGPASNFDPFYAAFNIKESDQMYIKPENRSKIW